MESQRSVNRPSSSSVQLVQSPRVLFQTFSLFSIPTFPPPRVLQIISLTAGPELNGKNRNLQIRLQQSSPQFLHCDEDWIQPRPSTPCGDVPLSDRCTPWLMRGVSGVFKTRTITHSRLTALLWFWLKVAEGKWRRELLKAFSQHSHIQFPAQLAPTRLGNGAIAAVTDKREETISPPRGQSRAWHVSLTRLLMPPNVWLALESE